MGPTDGTCFQLRYRSLFEPGRGFAFPCDDHGQVDLDHLSDRARNNYLYARAMVGKELAAPDIERAMLLRQGAARGT